MAKDIEVYTLKEIEDLLHVTRRTLYNWINKGQLKAFRIGKEWRAIAKSWGHGMRIDLIKPAQVINPYK